MPAVPKPTRLDDPLYREWVARHHCVVSNKDCQYATYLRGRRSDFCHLSSKGSGGGDEQGFPACRFHHQEQHRVGIKTFQSRHNLDLRVIASELYADYVRSR